jgi:predicted RNA-binding Zn-ribbon protein involved in translation (DUF1610 family)
MAITPPVLTCSTCDDYRLIPGEDGMLERCPDCLHVTETRCRAHGRSLRNGRCPQCSFEVTTTLERWEQERAARTVPAGKPLPELLTDVLEEACA